VSLSRCHVAFPASCRGWETPFLPSLEAMSAPGANGGSWHNVIPFAYASPQLKHDPFVRKTPSPVWRVNFLLAAILKKVAAFYWEKRVLLDSKRSGLRRDIAPAIYLCVDAILATARKSKQKTEMDENTTGDDTVIASCHLCYFQSSYSGLVFLSSPG